MGNSRGARKLARTLHVNQKKKKEHQEQPALLEIGSFLFSRFL